MGILLLCVLSKPLAIMSICAYQRFISPRKGWCCAYAALHAESSCSAYGKKVIADRGVLVGGILLWRRFGACRKAGIALAGDAWADKAAEECTDACDKSAKECADGCVRGCTCPPPRVAPKPTPKDKGSATLRFPLDGDPESRFTKRKAIPYFGFGDDWKVKDLAGNEIKCGGQWKTHVAADWPAEPNDPVYAVARGRVEWVGPTQSGTEWASTVVIQHGIGGARPFTTAYMHIDPTEKVKKAVEVERGELIGTIAKMSLPHLHFQIRLGPYHDLLSRTGALPQARGENEDYQRCGRYPLFKDEEKKFVDPEHLENVGYEWSRE